MIAVMLMTFAFPGVGELAAAVLAVAAVLDGLAKTAGGVLAVATDEEGALGQAIDLGAEGGDVPASGIGDGLEVRGIRGSLR